MWTVVALAGLLALRIGVLSVAGTDLFFDEAQYWAWSEELAAGYYSKPPLLAWIIRATTDLCGADSTFCIRLASPLLHTGTALIVFWLAAALYNARTAFFASLAFATLPGIALSSSIISTDVPLLFCWALALVLFVHLLRAPGSWALGLALGLAIGLGLNAKYAMAYAIGGAALFFITMPAYRDALARGPLWLALIVAIACLIPNVMWNIENGFATLSHTADNAKWAGARFNPGKAAEFFGAQFGVFGPILFGALLALTWRAWRQGMSDADWLLWCFAVPLILMITVQAFISRAHANWAAVAYVSACVLVVATMVRERAWRWLSASFVIHVAIVAALAVGVWQAGRFAAPGIGLDPFARTVGWAQLAKTVEREVTRAQTAGQPYGAILTGRRLMSSELAYYLRAHPLPQRAWKAPGGPPRDHFQQTRPYRGRVPGPLLYASVKPLPEAIAKTFAAASLVRVDVVPAGLASARTLYLYRLQPK